jgi:hypothetical protein
MQPTEVSVSYEKRVNDGDYGSEKVEIRLTAALEQGDDPVLVLQVLQMQLRGRVEQDLRQSVNRAVRQRMNPRARLCSECRLELGDHEDYVHPVCDELRRAQRDRERAEREAEYARRELVAVGADDDDADDDDEDEDEPR